MRLTITCLVFIGTFSTMFCLGHSALSCEDAPEPPIVSTYTPTDEYSVDVQWREDERDRARALLDNEVDEE